MRGLQNVKNMSLKRVLIFFFIFCFFLFSTSSVWAVSRDIGAGLSSECTFVGPDDTGSKIYNCKCQKSTKSDGNIVNGCHVGWLNSDPICACCGDCTLNNFLGLFINYANALLKYFAGTALLMFVIGGIMWITSGGSAEKVQKGKKVITGSIIGLIIILFSATIVNAVLKAFQADISLSDEPGLDWVSCPSPGAPPYDALKNKPWCHDCMWTGADKGCQGSGVKEYQAFLNFLYCKCGTPDGKFGPDTEACTKRFQQANGLGVDGMVGPNTYNVYLNPPLNKYEFCPE